MGSPLPFSVSLNKTSASVRIKQHQEKLSDIFPNLVRDTNKCGGISQELQISTYGR